MYFIIPPPFPAFKLEAWQIPFHSYNMSDNRDVEIYSGLLTFTWREHGHVPLALVVALHLSSANHFEKEHDFNGFRNQFIS